MKLSRRCKAKWWVLRELDKRLSRPIHAHDYSVRSAG
jgi:hypothetical protein